jgi:hypothetical protein
MFIAIPSFSPLYSMDKVVALCQPPVEEGLEVSSSSGGSLGVLDAVIKSPFPRLGSAPPRDKIKSRGVFGRACAKGRGVNN